MSEPIVCNKHLSEYGICDAGPDGERCPECEEVRQEQMAERHATEPYDDGRAQYERDMTDAGRGHLL